MRYVFLCLFSLALAACVSTKVVQTGGMRNGVQVLFEYPKDGRYTNLGLIDVTYYRPGWSPPSLEEAIPKVTEEVAKMGGNAVVIRSNHLGEWTRQIIVSAEVLRVPK